MKPNHFNLVALAALAGIFSIIIQFFVGKAGEAIKLFPIAVLMLLIFVISLFKSDHPTYSIAANRKKLRFAPIKGGFMATSIIGAMISIMYIYKQSPDWGIAFTLIFAVMFIASVVSMTVADPDLFVELESGEKKKK